MGEENTIKYLLRNNQCAVALPIFGKVPFRTWVPEHALIVPDQASLSTYALNGSFRRLCCSASFKQLMLCRLRAFACVPGLVGQADRMTCDVTHGDINIACIALLQALSNDVRFLALVTFFA